MFFQAAGISTFILLFISNFSVLFDRWYFISKTRSI